MLDVGNELKRQAISKDRVRVRPPTTNFTPDSHHLSGTPVLRMTLGLLCSGTSEMRRVWD